MKVGLESVVSYFPDTVVKREDGEYLDKFVPEGQEAFFKGADEFRRLKDDNATEILAENVARKALHDADLTTSDIDYIIAANIGGRRILPMVGTFIHEKLGFPEEVPVLNIQNVCASFVDGLNVAWSLVSSGRYKRVLIVTVTAVATKGWGVDLTSPMSRSFGDGAGAGIVSSENLKCEFVAYHNRTFGELYDHMYMDLFPHENPELKGKVGLQRDVGIYLVAGEGAMAWLAKVGKEFAVEGVKKALAEANLGIADLDMVVIHHPMEVMHAPWIDGGVEAGISREKWKELWNKIANCGNVDVPAVLSDLREKGQIPKDSIIALFPPGLGGHTPCMIIKWLV